MTIQSEFHSGFTGKKKNKKKEDPFERNFEAGKAKATKKKKIDKRIQLL